MQGKKRKTNYIDLLPEELYIFSPKEKEAIRDRARTCANCNRLSTVDMKCIMCSCEFPAMLANKNKECPMNKWGKF